jgi:hypothetical protein
MRHLNNTWLLTLKGVYSVIQDYHYGVSSAPGIFQRVMESLLHDLQGVVDNYSRKTPTMYVALDDILISGCSEEQHLKNLGEVLKRLERAGLRAKREKCIFMATSVEYLGYRIDASGIHPLKDKVKAINEAPPPKSVQELRAYLGLLSYYGKFLPKLSTVLHPLYQLLRKDHAWKWGKEQDQSFKAQRSC